ncbi:MAG: amidohydrolase family protein [Caulobacteraceae bacterium]|nr:amidohydrolase family protein [Caulobacteraceae bacterium]
MHRFKLLPKAAFAAAAVLLAAATPALAETVAIVNARIMTAGPQGTIENGTVVIRDGRIDSVSSGSRTPNGARIIDARGGVVTPGFFATGSELGAVEVGALGNDLGVTNPDVSAAFDVQYGLDPSSTLLPVARWGGITRAVVFPESQGGGDGSEHRDDGQADFAGSGPESLSHALFAGQAAVIQLGDGTDLLVRPKVGMVIPFGRAGARIAGGARGAEIVALKALFADVRDYARNRDAVRRGNYREMSLSMADLEALVPVVEGRMPIIAQANKEADIRGLLRLAREEGLKLIIEGGAEAWRVAPELAAARVPVILNPLTDLPASFEQINATMENAARLERAGVVVAFENSDNGSHRARETRYDAGNAVANGMSYEGALKAITINPATIFGVADRSGSLEAGKDADVVVWTGDPFEPLSQPTAVFIRGQQQPMTSRAQELRDRYRNLNTQYPPAYQAN